MTDATRKPGRPQLSPGGRVSYSASVPSELAAVVDAARGERTRSAVVVEALLAWIKRRSKPSTF